MPNQRDAGWIKVYYVKGKQRSDMYPGNVYYAIITWKNTMKE